MINAIPKILTEKWGDEITTAFIKVINDSEKNSRTDLATKSDLAATEIKLVMWYVGLWIAQMSLMIFFHLKK